MPKINDPMKFDYLIDRTIKRGLNKTVQLRNDVVRLYYTAFILLIVFVKATKFEIPIIHPTIKTKTE